MNLNIQIKTIITSFIYGIFIYYFLKINKNIIYNKNIIIKMLGSSLIVLIQGLLFFLIILNINSGIFHIYEILMIIFGYTLIAIKNKK